MWCTVSTLYAIHEHQTVWAHDQHGNLLTAADRVIEFIPETGRPSYWFMPECVGAFEPCCTACGTEELGEAVESGVLSDDDAISQLIKLAMGSRFDYNDRLRSNYYAANRAARGEG